MKKFTKKTRSCTRRPRDTAFTLTEILIALALVAVLLVGISRIFAITSQTIGTGQALSQAVRTQKAIQQTMSADLLGVLPTSSDIRPYSGIMPVNDASNRDAGMPFLTITNFRTPTYASVEASRADSIAPIDVTTMTPANFAARSLATRGADLDNNGTEAKVSISAAGGEMVPLYFYGDRNFRCDTVGFFSRGHFQSQTGIASKTLGSAFSTYQNDLTGSEAFIWYGHLRVFNGTANRLDFSNGYGAPGDWLTPNSGTGPLQNLNDRYANQFVLGRVQFILAEPTDHDLRPGTASRAANDGGTDRETAENNTVVVANDPSKPALFIEREWWDPNAHYITKSGSRPQPAPFSMDDSCVMFKPDPSPTSPRGKNFTLNTDDRLAGSSSSAVSFRAQNLRTDVAGVGLQQARQRMRFLANYDLGPDGQYNTADDTVPTTAAGTVPLSAGQSEWWEHLTVGWEDRYYCNPFVSNTPFDRTEPNINAKSIAQRQQILAQGVSQFIVEFAGDFVTQNADGSINTAANNGGAIPDGIIDFVAIPQGTGFNRQTRWYGLPRDVDGDGHIYISIAQSRTSPDVLPVSIFANSARYPFERKSKSLASVRPISLPPSNSDYATLLDEPNTATNGEDSGYICVWGPQDFERLWQIGTVAAPRVIRGAYPTMLRFVIDVIDEDGKLTQPVTQELIYRVPDDLAQPAN